MECGSFGVLRGQAHVCWNRAQLRMPTLKFSSYLLVEHPRSYLQ
jgi:hypothetical protein